MRRAKLVAACGALVAVFALTSATPAEQGPDGWVYDAMAAPATVSYTGVVQSLRVGESGSQVSEYRIEHLAPNQTLRRYTAPSNVAGDTNVTKGSDNYAIDSKRRRIVRSRNDVINDQIAIDNNYLLLRQNYRAVKRGYESYVGRDTIDLALVNSYTHKTIMLVRIDRQTKLVLDKQLYAGDGSLIAETRFEEVHYSPSIPASDFAIPGDYAVVAGPQFAAPSDDPGKTAVSAGIGAREPRFLPEGFSPVEGSVVAIKGVRTLHVLYSDGLRTVSLFENGGTAAVDMTGLRQEEVSVNGRDADYAQQGPTRLLAWRGGSLHYALVGELQLDELKRIASSIAP